LKLDLFKCQMWYSVNYIGKNIVSLCTESTEDTDITISNDFWVSLNYVRWFKIHVYYETPFHPVTRMTIRLAYCRYCLLLRKNCTCKSVICRRS